MVKVVCPVCGRSARILPSAVAVCTGRGHVRRMVAPTSGVAVAGAVHRANAKVAAVVPTMAQVAAGEEPDSAYMAYLAGALQRAARVRGLDILDD